MKSKEILRFEEKELQTEEGMERIGKLPSDEALDVFRTFLTIS